MRTRTCIGLAIELNGERRQEKPCYGTYHGDIPDKDFRFHITIVKHEGTFPVHSHEYAELVIVLEGHATHLTNFGNHPLTPGDVLVINKHTRHGLEEARELKLCNVMYDPGQFLRGNQDLERMPGYHALFELLSRTESVDFKQRLHLSTEDLVYVSSLVSNLKAEYNAKRDGRETSIRSMFLLLVTHLSRLWSRRKESCSSPLVRMARVMAHIQSHYREPLQIDELARLAHWSTSQFRRAFKRVYNMTPVRFINQLRLQQACEMLKDPNQNITEIALETGFSSSAFFSTQFRKFIGEKPSHYRQRHMAGKPGQDYY